MSDGPEKDPVSAKSNAAESSATASSSDQGEASSWYSWLRAAKEKTLSTYELVKSDLSEFGEAISQEANIIVSATSCTVKEKVPQLNQVVDLGSGIVKGLVTTVSSVLQGDDTTIGEEELEVPIRGGGTFEAKLYFLQTDPGTYCNEPEGVAELFEDWLDHFTLEERTEEIASLLRSSPELNALYSQLVPSTLSHPLFWQRYFYRFHQLQLEESRRTALLARSSSYEQPWDDLLTGSDEGQFVNKEDETETSSSPVPCLPNNQTVASESSKAQSLPCDSIDIETVGESITVVSDTSEDAVVVNTADIETESNSEGGSKLSDDWTSGESTPPAVAEHSETDNSEIENKIRREPPKGKPGVTSDSEEWVEWDG